MCILFGLQIKVMLATIVPYQYSALGLELDELENGLCDGAGLAGTRWAENDVRHLCGHRKKCEESGGSNERQTVQSTSGKVTHYCSALQKHTS